MKVFTILIALLFLGLPGAGITDGISIGISKGQSAKLTHPPDASAPQSTPQALPEPTGPYHVGTSVFHYTDTSRPDTLSKSAGRFRELMFQVWYPTDIAPKGNTAPYIPNPVLLRALKVEKYDGQETAVLDGLKEVRTSATFDAPLSRKLARFPLLFFSHGLGEPRSLYTALVQELASRGYVVVCIDHPYGGISVLPDGRVVSANDDPDAGNPAASAKQVEAWARDASFVLDRLSSPKAGSDFERRFAGRVDAVRVGMLGHSLGGAAALEACRTDSRFKACADLDGAPFGKVTEEGLRRPTLVMRSGPVYSDEDLAKRGRTREQWEEMGRQVREMWGSLFQKSKGVPVYSVVINGTGHMSYSDAPFVMPDAITRFGGRIIDAARGFEITSAYVRSFFDKYLGGKRSDLLDNKSPYTEVTAEKFNF